jgi:PhnB protein
MHARLVLDNGVLMAGDAMPGCSPYEGMKGFSLALTYDEASAARDVFARLGEGGSVTMAMESTFWADAFGMLVDRFGTPWIINGGMKPS